jgi:hypothetical protein
MRCTTSIDVHMSPYVGMFTAHKPCLTCNRHQEFQHEFYAKTVFSLHGVDLKGSLKFLSGINPAALQSIRSLVLQWDMYLPVYHKKRKARLYGKRVHVRNEERRWEDFCHIISKCPNLSNVHIKIFDGGFSPPDNKLLPPLNSISVENFTVQLPWNLDHEQSSAVSARGTYSRESCFKDEDMNFQLLPPAPGTRLVLARIPRRTKHKRPALFYAVAPIYICVMVGVQTYEFVQRNFQKFKGQ